MAQCSAEVKDPLKEPNEAQEVEFAAIFNPTEEEFKDPLAFINKIRPVAERFGICKVIPPSNWKPSFCLDMKTFKFTPRVQRLNELEVGSRMKFNFLEKLSKFWELQGQKFRIPTLERNQLDIYKLYKLVEEAGGYESLVKLKKWSLITKELKLKEPTSVRIIKLHYEKLLYPFLLFESGVTLPLNNSPKKEATDTSYLGMNSDSSSPTKVKKIEKTNNCSGNEPNVESINCLVCDRGDDEAMILLCDGCDDSYHTYCLFPPLKEIPKGDWRCPMCVAEICKKPTDLYGFGQSTKKYNLTEFGVMADDFKRKYFKMPHEEVTSKEIEEEFWKILANPDKEVIVEYGADLHTLETGSGFPTQSYKGKFNSKDLEYVDSPWNLNNLSKMEKSVLSQMNVEISGMKIPWAYVGMCFSCFCWHVEDHWSYSINYLHWGDTKTWYGVSGNHADQFEDCMKKNAHELFEKSPDLLHHLVTIMNPAKFKKYGVPIYKINQNAGEFVITFPRAYHAGFNEGFNFAEAVNFCPADWMKTGRAAIEHYKQVKRHTVFSHDELVCKIATSLKLTDLNIIMEIKKELETIIHSEEKIRWDMAEKKIFKKSNKIAFESLTDDERTCDYCKTTCFTSAIYCSCRPYILTCLNHHEHLCKNSKTIMSPTKKQKLTHNLTFIYRYTTDEMTQILKRLDNYTNTYFLWCRSVEAILNLRHTILPTDISNEVIDLEKEDTSSCIKLTKKPRLKRMFELLEQARINNYPRIKNEINIEGTENVNLYAELDIEYKRAQQCAEYCNHFITLYKRNLKTINQNKFDQEGLIDFKSMVKVEEMMVDDDFDDQSDDDIIFVKKSIQKSPLKRKVSIDKLRLLVNNLDKLVCEIDEHYLLVSIYNEALEYEKKIDRLIAEWIIESPNQLKRLLNYINRIDIEFPELKVEQLKVMHKQAVWLSSVNLAVQTPKELTIYKISDLIDKAMEENLLVTFNNNLNSKQIVEKTFVDLQELLSISQTWDNKAKEQMNSSCPLKLEEIEQTISEAKCIPACITNVERLSQIAEEANMWILKMEKVLSIDKTVKDPHFPYLSELIELLEKAKDLPVKLPINLVQMKIELINDWIAKVNRLFNVSKLTKFIYDPHIKSSSLVDMLTPRLDINPLLTKLQNSNQTSTTSDKPSKRKVKSASIDSYSETLSSSIEELSSLSIYTHEKNFNKLREQIKQLELKELLHIKQLRSFNQERLTSLKGYRVSELGKEASKSANLNVKCASCFKLLNSQVYSNHFTQCKLCLGFFHMNNACKGSNKSQSEIKLGKTLSSSSTINDYLKQGESTIDLCFTCKRTKRPCLNLILENVISIEKLDVKSYETNALQLFVERVLNWQERFKEMFEATDLKELQVLIGKSVINKFGADKDSSDKNIQVIKNKYKELPNLKKVELNECYIESLLLEVEIDEVKFLNQLFDIINEEEKKLDESCHFEKLDFIENGEYLNESNSDETTKSDETKHSKKKLKLKPTSRGTIKLKIKTTPKKKNSIGKKSLKSNDSNSDTESNGKRKFNAASKKIRQKKRKESVSKKSIEMINEPSRSTQNTYEDSYNSKESENEEYCAALKCIEPLGDNIKWVQCDGSCNRWFHMFCVGITKIRKKETYLCETCTKKKGEYKKLEIKEEPIETHEILNEISTAESVNLAV